MVMMDSASMDRHHRRMSPCSNSPISTPHIVRRRGRKRPRPVTTSRVQAILGTLIIVSLGLGLVVWNHKQTNVISVTNTAELLDDDASYDPLQSSDAVHPEPKSTHQHHNHHLRHHDNSHNNNIKSHYDYDADAIVVGSGLAGMTTALEILDRGGSVVILEKSGYVGGNSLKASSGINTCCYEDSGDAGDVESTLQYSQHDTLEVFESDTTKSAGSLANSTLIHALVSDSRAAVEWLQSRLKVDLSQVAQLGGHSFPRTHRPSVGMVGAELMTALEREVRKYERNTATILTNTQVTELQQRNGRVVGVKVQYKDNDNPQDLPTSFHAPNILLATGGFASDRHHTTSILAHYRPDLLKFGTTGGLSSTGDGIHLASKLGASLFGMKDVQLHPTGFVDPRDVDNPTKVLAAELLRGVGGILLNGRGQRFCNELGTRDYVTNQMLHHNENSEDATIPTFTLLLTAQAAAQAQHHVDRYVRQGTMTQLEGWSAVAEYIQEQHVSSVATVADLEATWMQYQQQAAFGAPDAFGKTVFPNVDTASTSEAQQQQSVFYVGTVTPVLHYCMGGVSMDEYGHVLNESGNSIPGLFAAGEVTGGVHGKNRLGGNSLLECAVFGRRIGRRINIQQQGQQDGGLFKSPRLPTTRDTFDTQEVESTRVVSQAELQQHASPDDLWMAIDGKVYNLTSFAPEHPGGANVLYGLAGTDATAAFGAVHSQQLLKDLSDRLGSSLIVGLMEEDGLGAKTQRHYDSRVVTKAELRQHATPDDCWVILHGNVYDLTKFSVGHKGGAYLIQKHAGGDATSSFKVFHKKDMLALIVGNWVGVYQEAAAEK